MLARAVRENKKKRVFNSPALWVVIAAEGLESSTIFLLKDNSVN